MAVHAAGQASNYAHYRNEERGENTVRVSGEESNRNVELSFELSCV